MAAIKARITLRVSFHDCKILFDDCIYEGSELTHAFGISIWSLNEFRMYRVN